MTSRRIAVLLAALAAGGGLASCGDRQNEEQSNQGGEPGSVTTPNPELGGGTEGTTTPESVTETVGTLPSPEESPDIGGGESDPGDADSNADDGEG